MTEAARRDAFANRQACVDIVVPVYNEATDLETSVRRLRSYLDQAFPFDAVITIADNASTDTTWEIASRLAADVPGVRALHLDLKGRGRALKAAWSTSCADVVTYMDVDLSTDLDALLPLVAPLVSGHSDVAIGTRLARGSRVIRGPKRELISRVYNLILRLALHNRFSDAQCGFKAIRASDARLLLPAIVDDGFFFDTELLVLAERNGLRIHEVPVDWSDDPDSRVHVAKTAAADLKGVWRLMHEISSGGRHLGELKARRQRDEVAEVARFAGVGLLSTVVYLALFLFLQDQVRFPGYAANIVSLAACSVGNIAAQLRFTFSEHGSVLRGALFTAAWMTFFTSVALTLFFLAMAQLIDPRSPVVEILALLVGNGLAAFVRFVIIRGVAYSTHLRAGPRTEAPILQLYDPVEPRQVASEHIAAQQTL